MGPHTITGWLSYAAVMASSAMTGVTAVKITLDLNKRQIGDRQDIITVATFATMTMLAALLFWYAEAR